MPKTNKIRGYIYTLFICNKNDGVDAEYETMTRCQMPEPHVQL